MPVAAPQWAALALVCVPVFVGALDLTVVSAVLPSVIFELGIPLQSGLDQASWVVSGYFLAYALGILAWLPTSDESVFHQRRIEQRHAGRFYFEL